MLTSGMAKRIIIKPCKQCGQSFRPLGKKGGKTVYCSPTCIMHSRLKCVGDGCWEWPKFCDKNGYGRTKLNGKTTVATRVAWQLTRAPIPVGLFVLHECDNPPCCRPSHLFLGTQKDNCQDAKSKDRHSRGTRNGIAKLSDDAVRDIRTSKLTQWELARKYGVWQAAIWQVIHRKRWQHVLD